MSQADHDWEASIQDKFRRGTMFNVTDAKREQLIGAVAFIGASGAGKTLSMLKTAKGFMDRKYPDASDAEKWQKVGVVDTEHERSKIYAGTSNFGLNIGAFKHLDFQAPYTVDRLDAAIKFLKEQHNVEIIIVDSTTHFYSGEGGILDLQQKFGGSFQAWRDVNPHYDRFISLVTGEKYRIDMLNGIRAKQHYEVSQNEVGKLQVQKMGLKPDQRDSLEYEFHIVFNIDMEHIATPLKDNSGMFNGEIPKQIETDVGEQLYDWLKTGVDIHAERAEKEKAEAEEKEAVIQTIRAYADSQVAGMKEYVVDLIKRAEKTYGELNKLPLDRLHGFVKIANAKEVELKKEADEIGSEVASELNEHQKDLDAMIVKDLQEVAKSFNITGISGMKKDELIAVIKAAQNQTNKPLQEALNETYEKHHG